MAITDSGPSLSGKLPQRKQQKKASFTEKLLASASLLIMMGLLITGTGIICYFAFRNPLSELFVDTGMILCLSGFALKIADICIKITGGRV